MPTSIPDLLPDNLSIVDALNKMAPSPRGPVPAPAVQYLVADGGQIEQRIDNFLITRLKGVPRTHIYRILRRGEVRVNKGRIRPDYRLRPGDVVRVPPVRHASSGPAGDPVNHPPPAHETLRRIRASTLYEDAGLLVLNKPTGMAVHGGSGQRYGVIEALRALRPDAPYLELVHRLDRETSGCLMIATRRSVLRALHEALRQHRVDKRYLLLVAGRWQGKGRRVESALRKNTLSAGERVVREEAGGKPAVTHFRPLAVASVASLLEARIVTGRTHQVRVQATSLGYPVAGDDKYGDRAFNREMRRLGLGRLFLHAASLGLPSGIPPENMGRRPRITAPLPRELVRVLEAIGIGPPQQNHHQPEIPHNE